MSAITQGRVRATLLGSWPTRGQVEWTWGAPLAYVNVWVRIHHLAVGARDVESLAEFYRRAFELPEQARHYQADGQLRSVWLDLGGSVLMIEASSVDAHRVEGIGRGLFLVAFAVNVADRDRVEARLVALGGALEERGRFTSYARDPEGNRVAISHYPEPPVAEAPMGPNRSGGSS